MLSEICISLSMFHLINEKVGSGMVLYVNVCALSLKDFLILAILVTK